ncbi:antitoxin [Candidatus Woesearchaeota archaeon CG1_02_57_44]|nr:MAG: antitoxin [Candidatus Woesearchaeota archaeon CG1_02_57_44]PIN70833.1 MAG: antitoxin [Candidatus Woesearchaeota archaeon CG11_big_fil_rev_8_21_14_0_20_57_5]
MVQAMINITDRSNRVLNVIKAKYGLKDKSEAIEMVVSRYQTEFLEPELRPEYIEKMKKIEKGKFHAYESVKALREELENAKY